MFIDGYEVIVGASIGSASAPDDGSTPEAILSNADMALYAAKGEGRGNWRAFEKSMDAKIQIRRLIELDLRAAVANDAIEVYYQPIVAVATGEVAGFEALARWNHPVRGRVSPGEFIPIVEELGLMEELGASVLRRACLACAAWPNDISVSVNLSPMQFRNGRVEQTVLEALRAANLPPERLDLEITESTLLDDRGSTRATLESLRKLGIRISLDDFGTGYSSLSYVLAFPLDRIKIDRSFTIGLGLQERASILVESVAQMCAQTRHERPGGGRRNRPAAALHRARRLDLRGPGLLFQPGRSRTGSAQDGRRKEAPERGLIWRRPIAGATAFRLASWVRVRGETPVTPAAPRSNPTRPWRRSPTRARIRRRRGARRDWRRRSGSPIGAPLTNQVSGRAPPSALSARACLALAVLQPEIDARAVGRKGDLQRRRGGRGDRLGRVLAQMAQRRRQIGARRDAQHALGRADQLDVAAEPREGVEQDRRGGLAADQARRRAVVGPPDPDGDGRRPCRSRSPARRESRRRCRS